MNDKYESFLDIQVPADVLSVAMNGLLHKQSGVTQIQSDYHINVKNDILINRNSELSLLHANFFQYMESMHIHFEPMSPGFTRMYYTIYKKSIVPGVIGMTILDLFMATVMGVIFAGLDFGVSSILVFLLAFFVTALIFSMFPLIPWSNQRDKIHQKRLVKQFMPRLDSYVKVVMKNSMNR